MRAHAPLNDDASNLPYLIGSLALMTHGWIRNRQAPVGSQTAGWQESNANETVDIVWALDYASGLIPDGRAVNISS